MVVVAPSLVDGKDLSDSFALSELPRLEEFGTKESTV